MKDKYYLGVDIGSISTKGVIIDSKDRIVASDYLWTEGNPIEAVKNLIKSLYEQVKDKNINVVSVGTTGSARYLIGKILGASVVKNEITAHAIGTMNRVSDVKTIIEIGGQDSKIILIDNGVVIDYNMNTICAAGTGAFLSSQAKRLGVEIEDFGSIALKSKNSPKLSARCSVFAESDLVHKLQMGYKKEDVIKGLCEAITSNYLNNVAKGKQIKSPIVFQGGVSKNIGVKKAFEDNLGKKVIVIDDGHLMGALGIALIAKKSKLEKTFDFNIKDVKFKTIGRECSKCSNNCEIVNVYKENEIIDCYGNKCERGVMSY
ncbi:MAG: 2-hydroxyglutaryl-CoA dehydratase [Bacilli bacterium]|nr:2-hydroxyglutaryl-CoA dehydratase [Bacilli bacterium]